MKSANATYRALATMRGVVLQTRNSGGRVHPNLRLLGARILGDEHIHRFPRYLGGGLPNLSAESAGADAEENLWIASRYRGSNRLIRISPKGEITADVPVPESIKPKPPADIFALALATSAPGTVALLARYSHGGKVIYFDGAAFARMRSDGTLSAVKKVAGAGPEFIGNRSDATSLRSDCTVLHSRDLGQHRTEYMLSSFNSTFKRNWSVSVLGSAPAGGEYKIAAVAAGYIVAIQTDDGLLLAKYSPSGQSLWSVSDTTRRSAHFVIRSGAGFYLIGAGVKNRYALHVIRGH